MIYIPALSTAESCSKSINILKLHSLYQIAISFKWDKQENNTKQDIATDVVTFYPPLSTSNASLGLNIDDISDEKKFCELSMRMMVLVI